MKKQVCPDLFGYSRSDEPQRAQVLRKLEFEITHRCNKHCELCDHRIGSSNYDLMSMDDYEHICRAIADKSAIETIQVIGGEPFCHPELNDLIKRMFDDFPRATVWISTNASLMDRLDSELARRVSFYVSHYPGFNDEMVATLRGRDGVVVHDKGDMWDPYVDPDLPSEVAQQVRRHCRHQVRVVGRRLYNCCAAESIERWFETETVHVEFGPTWQDDLWTLPTWKACQHCFRAEHVRARLQADDAKRKQHASTLLERWRDRFRRWLSRS